MTIVGAFITAILCASGAHGEIVDRIAANVNSRVITESEVKEAARISAFIEGTELRLGKEDLRQVLDRLIDQTLMRREVEFVRFQTPEEAEAKPLLDQIKARFADEKSYREALAKYEIKEEALIAQLRWQLAMLRFIEYRFQPAVEVTNSLVLQEYRQQARNWRQKNGTEPPPLESIRGEIDKIVRQRLIDSAMDRWLGEVRTQTTIIYHEGFK